MANVPLKMSQVIPNQRINASDYEGFGIPSVPNPDPNNPVETGEVHQVKQALSHLFMLASDGIDNIVLAGIRAGLPMRAGMTVGEIIEVFDMIAGVSFAVNAKSGYSAPNLPYVPMASLVDTDWATAIGTAGNNGYSAADDVSTVIATNVSMELV